LPVNSDVGYGPSQNSEIFAPRTVDGSTPCVFIVSGDLDRLRAARLVRVLVDSPGGNGASARFGGTCSERTCTRLSFAVGPDYSFGHHAFVNIAGLLVGDIGVCHQHLVAAAGTLFPGSWVVSPHSFSPARK